MQSNIVHNYIFVVVCFIAFVLGPTAFAADSPVHSEFGFGRHGLMSIKIADHELLHDGSFSLRRVVFRREDGSTHRDKSKPVKRTYDAGEKQQTVIYDWGRISCEYRTERRRLTMTIRVQNSSSHVLHQIHMKLLELKLSGEVSAGKARNNVGEPSVIPCSWAGGVMALCNHQINRPLRLSLRQGKGGIVEAHLQAGGDKMVYDTLYLRRPIPPGKNDTYVLSLRLGGPEMKALGLGKDVFKKFREAHPRKLDWPDRGPITRHFFGGGMAREKIVEYFRDPESVELPEATDEFRERILSAIDRNIAASKEIGAQAIIVWDIEGNSFPHPITYIGDPRLTKVLNPKMNDVADEMFKRIRQAGLRAGICIRPTQVKYMEKKGTMAHRHTPVLEKYPDNPVLRQLDAKITYAKERWGCTVFYIDTPFFWRPRGPKDKWSAGMIRAEVWGELLEKHPKILMIPEFHYLEQLAYVIPYAEYDMGFKGTSEYARRVYPKACTVAVVEDADPYEKWDLMVRNVREGDALMTFSHGMTRNAKAIKHIYDAAELEKAGVPRIVKRSDTQQVLKEVRQEARKDKKLNHLVWCIGRALRRMGQQQ